MAVAPPAFNYQLLIKQLLHAPLAHAPDQQIVYRDQVRISYRELAQRIARLANGLAALGVRHGDTVAMMDWDSHRYLECYFAVPMMGAILQTVNVRLSPEQLLHTLNHCGPKVILLNQEFLPLLASMKGKLRTVERVVVIADDGLVKSSTIDTGLEYEAMLASSAPVHDFPDFDENTTATAFYTTGTTGLPKGVFFSHRQLVLHTLAVLSALAMPKSQGRFHREDVYMPMTPMFHVHAWGMPYVATAAGVKQVYPGRYTPEMLLHLKEREGVSFSHCVPTVLDMLLNYPAAQRVDMQGWKMVIGGSALPKALAESALSRGIDVFAGYGMSETGPVLTLSQLKPQQLAGDSDEQVAQRIKAGFPIPLVEVRIVDADMSDVPADGHSAGEIVARSPWLTQGYINNPDASSNLWAGGYLHTNDIGVIDGNGCLQITDRLKDVIKTGGEWLSSLDIENIITQHPAVREAAVIGIPDAHWGERPLALVVLKNADFARLTVGDIQLFMSKFVAEGVISKYGIPESVMFVPHLAKTSLGKFDKKMLRQLYAPVAGAPPAAATAKHSLATTSGPSERARTT